MSVRSLKEADYVTTTGRKLKITFSNFNKNVSIYRNMFDWDQPQWRLSREAKNGKIIVGWVGLTSHFEDIRKMVPLFRYLHDKFQNTHFVLSGMAIKDTEVLITADEKGNKKFDEKDIVDETKTYRYKVKELFKDFDQNRIEFHDASSLETYGKFYKDLDIGLAYLENLTFNQCKSEIKVVEYMKYGVIPVWTNLGGYKDMYETMPEDLKKECKSLAIETENPTKWKEVLDDIVVNIDKWRNIAKDCEKWVEETYDINKQVHDRVDFYSTIIEEHLERETNRIKGITSWVD